MSLTASKLSLARQCLGAFALPWRDERNAYSDAGNALHAADEAAIASGDAPLVYQERWPDHTWQSEVAFRYNVATNEARVLGIGIGRAYPDREPFEVDGTADVVGVKYINQRPGHVVIIDRKSFDPTGPPPSRNPQVRFLALAAARAFSVDNADVAINHEVRGLEVAQMDAFDLDGEHLAIRNTVVEVAGVKQLAREGKPLPLNTGPACRWCPAFSGCPRQSDLVQLVRREDRALAELRPSELPVLSADNAADVYRLWKQIGMLHKRVGESLYSYASRETVFLGDGRAFGKVTKQGNEKLDGDVTYRIVGTAYGQEIADAAVIRSATKTRLKEALSKVAGKGQLASVERQVLDAIRAAGGSERIEREVIEEHDIKLKLASGGES